MSDEIYTNEFGVPFVEVDGVPRMLGCLPPDPLFSAFVDIGTQMAILPEAQWQENSMRDFHPPQRNQLVYSSCCGHATVTAFTVAKTRSAPSDELPMLSGTYIYGFINNGKDQGAVVGHAMQTLVTNGTCYESQVPSNVIYKSQFPSAAFTTATRFKALEAYRINSFEELCTALTYGFPCVSGMAVGKNFTHNQLKDNGLALLPDVIVGGHALPHLGLKRLEGKWVVETFNSWGTEWGQSGWCYLQKEAWSPGYGFPFDCFAIYSVIDDPQEEEDQPPSLVSSSQEEEE